MCNRLQRIARFDGNLFEADPDTGLESLLSLHLAAAVGVALIARQPMETIERNIHPTELLLDALVQRWGRGERVKFFLASTSEVYGKNPKPTWTEEEDLVFGATTKARWSYGASKAIDEFLGLACWREYRLPVVIGRFFNVVGPRQSGAYGMVLPRFVEAALAGRPLIVHDDGHQVRCFAHVRDVLASVLELMDTDAALGRVFNIGSDQPVSILELAQQVVRLAGSPSPIQFQSYAEAYDEDFEDVRRRVPDLTRLHRTIQHRNRYDLEAVIRAVIEHQTAAASIREKANAEHRDLTNAERDVIQGHLDAFDSLQHDIELQNRLESADDFLNQSAGRKVALRLPATALLSGTGKC